MALPTSSSGGAYMKWTNDNQPMQSTDAGCLARSATFLQFSGSERPATLIECHPALAEVRRHLSSSNEAEATRTRTLRRDHLHVRPPNDDTRRRCSMSSDHPD